MNGENYHAILIPGGGLTDKGELLPWVKARLNRALEIEPGETFITLSAGTTHKPLPRDAEGFPIFESVAAAGYLRLNGVDPQRILTETSSYDTIGNAYFARVIHVQPRGFRRLLVITSAFHLPRTEAVFRWVFGLDAPEGYYDLHFEATPDVGMAEVVLETRKMKERARLAQVEELRGKIRTMAAFHEWLFTEHGAYAVGALPEVEEGEIVDTY